MKILVFRCQTVISLNIDKLVICKYSNNTSIILLVICKYSKLFKVVGKLVAFIDHFVHSISS